MSNIYHIGGSAFEIIGKENVDGKDGFRIRDIENGEEGFIDAETFVDSQR